MQKGPFNEQEDELSLLFYLVTMVSLKDILTVSPESLQALANDSDVADSLRDVFPHPYSLDDAKQFLDLNRQGIITNSFAVYSDGVFVGLAGIVTKSDIHRINGEIGYWIGKKFWGQGIATAAVKLLIPFAFEELGLHRLYAGIFETNKPSMRVLEKAGFKLEVVLKSSLIKNGKIMDEYLYSLVKE